MLTIKKQKYNSVLVQADTQTVLCETFMRFQEYYESPKFRNTIFTIGQLKNWYSETYGADTYNRDWSGFNFPHTVLCPFRQGLFDPLTPYEQELLDLFRYRTDNFYVIGANDEETIRHELAHALYYNNVLYKNQINQICKIYNKQLQPIKKYLISKGYCEDVLNDEIQAYVTDNSDDFIIKNLDSEIIDKLNKTYNMHKD